MEGVKFEIYRLIAGKGVEHRADHGVIVVTGELPDIEERGDSRGNVLQDIEPAHQARRGAHREQHGDPEGNAAETVKAVRADGLGSEVDAPGPGLAVQKSLVHGDAEGNRLRIVISAQRKGAFVPQNQPQKRQKGDKRVDGSALPERLIACLQMQKTLRYIIYRCRFSEHKPSCTCYLECSIRRIQIFP